MTVLAMVGVVRCDIVSYGGGLLKDMTMTVSAMVAVVRCDIVSYGNGRKM
jgi:hypothetical protein